MGAGLKPARKRDSREPRHERYVIARERWSLSPQRLGELTMHRRHISLLSVVWLAALVALSPSLLAQESPPAETPRDMDALVGLYDRPPPADVAALVEPLPPAEQAAPMTPDNLNSWSEIAFQSARYGWWGIYRMRPDLSNLFKAVVSGHHNSYPSLRLRGADRLVFVSIREGNVDIYTANPDGEGSGIVRLTDHPANDLLPVWSPDGTQIAFQSERSGNTDVYVMNADGSNLRRLTGGDVFDGHPTWSPDGTRIAFSSSRSGRYQIWVMGADGSNPYPLTNVFGALYPSWSPADDAIAFSGIYGLNTDDAFLDLFLMNTDGTNVRAVAMDELTDMRGLAWAPNGSEAAYIGTEWMVVDEELEVKYSGLRLAVYDGHSLTAKGYTFYDNGLIWSASWASLDAQPPTACVVHTPAIRPWSDQFVWWEATDEFSGIRAYEAQRRVGSGDWQPVVLPALMTTSALDRRAPGETVEWRCRAIDQGSNRSAWAEAPVARALVDGVPPGSRVTTVASVDADTVQVSWKGSDTGSGVATYDVWTREGVEGDWKRWQYLATVTTASFTGKAGHTYYFRSQAVDRAGNREPWRPVPQAEMTLGEPDAATTPRAGRHVFLPTVTAIAGSTGAIDSLSIADWPTLGGNPAHSGVNSGDPGASRYALAWSATLDGYNQHIAHQVTSAGGVVLVAAEKEDDYSDFIAAYDVEMGTRMWRYTSNSRGVGNPPTIANGAAYLVTNHHGSLGVDCHLSAIDLYTGIEYWSTVYTCGLPPSFQHPLVVGDHLYLGNHNHVSEYSAATGVAGWRSDQTGNSLGWTPAYTGGRIFGRAGTRALVELDAATGALIYLYEGLNSDSLDTSAAPVAAENVVLATGYDLVALDTRTHRPRWTVAGDGTAWFKSITMPAVTASEVYALRGRAVVAYNLITGVEVWRFVADANLLSAPVVAGNYVYVASTTHTYVLNRQTHELVWDTPVGGVLSLANGYLFIAESSNRSASTQAVLHAFRAQEP